MTATAVLCGIAMTLFFVRHSNDTPPALEPAEPDSAQLCQMRESTLEEQAYYNEEADEYLKILPDDKALVLRLIDDSNHHIIYYEKSDAPSCYIYDLESLTTSVLFGGENGFYCDTKLLIIGAIQDWELDDSKLVFTAVNRAPEADSLRSSVVFTADIFSHELQFVGFKSR